ncbi:MAG: Npun_F5749 family FMN-dependent PPOX-type flavoprotein [Cyanobacteria bacterium J06639_1]
MLPSWKSNLLGALRRNRSDPGSRFVQFATVTPDGDPSNRTVVYRGFMPDSDRLQFVTDIRSDKIAHLEARPRAAACWYFSKTREQFRITGAIAIVTADSRDPWQHARNSLWDSLSDNSKLLWYWPQPKGDRAESEAFIRQVPSSATTPPESFGLLVLSPTEVDWLQLRGDPQNRFQYVLTSGGWQGRAVNP